MPPKDSHLEKVAAIADHLIDKFENDPDFRNALAKYAPPGTDDKLERMKREMFEGIFNTTAAKTREEILARAENTLQIGIRAADVMVAAVVNRDKKLDAELKDYFVRLKTNPDFAEDYTKVFEDAGATTLAALSRKANPLKKKPSRKKSPHGKSPRKGM